MCTLHVADAGYFAGAALGPVRPDDTAIAGFFEDLPVLLIVLAGVTMLVVSGVAASERLSEQRVQRALDALAARFTDSIMLSLSRSMTHQHISMASIESVNISRCAADALGLECYHVAFVEYFPDVRWVRSESRSEDTLRANTGYAAHLVNAVMPDGGVVIVGVIAIVWR